MHRGDGQASAQAPGHSPADRSVSIKSVDGMVLMHCHAGEDKHDVLAAVGLQMRDLFDNRRDLRHEYSDGRIVVRSYTTPGKKAFTQRGNKTGTALYHADRIGAARNWCTSSRARRTCSPSRPPMPPRSVRRWAPARPRDSTGHRYPVPVA